MGVEYSLVNISKREYISFEHMAGSKARELAGNPAQAAVVTWYLLHNQGDAIQFVSDTYGEWPFSSGQPSDISQFKDVTSTYIDQLIQQGILKNEGMVYQDEEEPDSIYILKLTNIWLNH